MLSPAEARLEPRTAQAPAVVFEHVALAFDDFVVLRDVSFSIPVGGLTVLLGASGSGKSLILKMILGLMRPDSGSIHVNGQRIDNPRRILGLHVGCQRYKGSQRSSTMRTPWRFRCSMVFSTPPSPKSIE